MKLYTHAARVYPRSGHWANRDWAARGRALRLAGAKGRRSPGAREPRMPAPMGQPGLGSRLGRTMADTQEYDPEVRGARCMCEALAKMHGEAHS